MKKQLLTFILSIGCLIGFAQYGFTPAVLITKQNDTIRCEVQRAVAFGKHVTYRNSEAEPELSILSKNVKSIRSDKMYWENITLGKKERIMNLVADGNIRLFNHVTINSGTPSAGPGGNGTYTPYTAPTIVFAWQKDGVYYEVKKNDLKERTEQLMFDCPGVVEKVKNKEYAFESMGVLVREYNSCK